MKTVMQYDKGDEVYVKYVVESRFYKNDEMFYKLREPINGTYLDYAYTADELIPVKEDGKE